MKNLIMVTIIALSLHSGIAYAEQGPVVPSLTSSTWHKILRPPLKTIAIATDITAVISAIVAIFSGADFLITHQGAAKERFFESVGWLFGSYILNVFSKVALQELSH